jgi:tRNA pseudouridine38-40 synthase
VQGELCSALAVALGTRVLVTGSSRTDAGVHALGFVARIDAEGATVPPERLALAAAKFLPPDISIVSAVECGADFHPRYNAVSKEYIYRIENKRVRDPFEVSRSWFLPRVISDEGIEKMREAAQYILGEHDFAAFMSEGSDVTSTVRCVHALDIEKNDGIITVRISADGFLYNMVRIIVGTLCEVGFGRFTPDEVGHILALGDRKNAGPTAPPEGLYLNKVNY